MKIAITGGTGFVGRHLTNLLIENGHEVFILTRNIAGKNNNDSAVYVEWLHDNANPEAALEGIDAFINLAGESINSGRWTAARKARILDSRITATKEMMRIIMQLQKKPEIVINASAVGYYGISDSLTFTEASTASGNDFLAHTVQKWEETASEAEAFGIRTAYCRFGIILDSKEGALPKMVLPYKLFAGGTIGSGLQWLSWIHIHDVSRAILYILENKEISGPVNFTAPNPATMKEFGQTLAKCLGKPHWLPAPSFAIRLALGEMSILITEGQKVLPAKLLDHGYSFQFEQLQPALADIYS